MELESTNYPLQLQINYFSEVSPSRECNQDNFYVCGHSNLFTKPYIANALEADTENLQAIALFDGMGGESYGERASLIAAEKIRDFISSMGNVLSEESISAAGRKYCASFAQIISNFMGEDTSVCGTTFVGAILHNQYLIPAWLGDSRAYLLRGQTLHRLTRDHSRGQQKVDKGIISEEDAKNTHDWHVLTGFMGQFDAVLSVGDPVSLRPGDKIFLCSDGITDKYTDQELQKILSKATKESIQLLLNMAQSEAEDNCTAIIIDIKRNPLCIFSKILSRRVSQWQHTLKSKVKK